MNIEKLKEANKLANAISDTKAELKRIEEMHQKMSENRNQVKLRLEDEHGDIRAVVFATPYIEPEIKDALGKAQIRLRQEIARMEKQFELL